MTATARQSKTPREPKKGVSRRFRKDNERAKRNEEEYLEGVERGVLLTLPPRPAPEPEPQRVPLRERDLLPVARPVMKDPKGELAWLARVGRNRVAHHFTHLDLHALAYARSAKRGTRRLVWGVRDYVQMPDSLRVLAELSDGSHPDSKEHGRLARKYEKKRKLRAKHVRACASVIGPAVLIVLVVLWFGLDALLGGWRAGQSAPVTVLSWVGLDRLLNGWATLPLVAVATTSALAYYGRGRSQPTAMVVAPPDTRRVPKIEGRPSSALVHAAFENVGIPNVAEVEAIHRSGHGWETTIRIPVGNKSFPDAAKAHNTLAGNLGVGSEGLFLERGETEKHVIVWWSKQDPFAGAPVPHPLLDPRSGPADLWNEGIPIGIDARGSQVRIPAVDTPFGVIGGQPGAGKTFALFGIGASAGSDPIWDLDVWSFKPSNDFAPLEPLVRAGGGTFRFGADDDTFKAFLRYLKALRSEVIARNERLADLPFDRNPHAKVERDVAADPALGMRPRIVIADEIQTALPHPGVLAELIEIGRVARSQNVVMIFGMQFVDSDTIEQLQRLLGSRICLSVARVEDSRGVLGGAHEPGVAEGHKIPLTAKAVAIVAGAVSEPGKAPRGAFKMRFYGIESRQALADHVARCLTTVRAGQAPAVSLAKSAEDPFVARLVGALGDGPKGVSVLAVELGYGDGVGAVRQFTNDARRAGIEPRTEHRDAGGVVARGAKYIAPDQVPGH